MIIDPAMHDGVFILRLRYEIMVNDDRIDEKYDVCLIVTIVEKLIRHDAMRVSISNPVSTQGLSQVCV